MQSTQPIRHRLRAVLLAVLAGAIAVALFGVGVYVYYGKDASRDESVARTTTTVKNTAAKQALRAQKTPSLEEVVQVRPEDVAVVTGVSDRGLSLRRADGTLRAIAFADKVAVTWYDRPAGTDRVVSMQDIAPGDEVVVTTKNGAITAVRILRSVTLRYSTGAAPTTVTK